MDTPAQVREVEPTSLPLGTKVGAWRVCGIRGRGTFGTVYRAAAEGRAQPGLVALKLAIYAEDARFEREAELLSRLRHPSVPRLLGSGVWRSPSGAAHPFVVMDWVEGEPLYVWAARRNPSSRQVLALLAQAAGALQATHEVAGLHRDVKGDNMLVRPSDGRLFLTDFGVGYVAGAARLTPLNVVPGTREYRSPELWRCAQRSSLDATTAPLARPADDVFALGVTAYWLLTDSYPPFPRFDTESGQCVFPGGGVPPPRQRNPRVDAQLNALIWRMLSPRPEERGTAGELAEAMERGVAHAGPPADAPLFEWETLRPSQWTEDELADAEHLGHRPRRRDRELALRLAQADAECARAKRKEVETSAPAAVHLPPPVGARRWLPWLAALLALGLWPEETGSLGAGLQPTNQRGAVSTGDTALGGSAGSTKSPIGDAIAQELPKQPLPGQLKPDAKGRCPNKQVAINGGCWLKVDFMPDECPGHGRLYQGGCYIPFFGSSREPASAPRERR